MARPKSNAPLKDKRIPIMMTLAELKAVDDWRFSNRVGSRSEAIRRLCQIAIGVELKVEFSRLCADDPTECPSFIWETLCEEHGVDSTWARGAE